MAGQGPVPRVVAVMAAAVVAGLLPGREGAPCRVGQGLSWEARLPVQPCSICANINAANLN